VNKKAEGKKGYEKERGERVEKVRNDLLDFVASAERERGETTRGEGVTRGRKGVKIGCAQVGEGDG